jgi:hypothetical protein
MGWRQESLPADLRKRRGRHVAHIWAWPLLIVRLVLHNMILPEYHIFGPQKHFLWQGVAERFVSAQVFPNNKVRKGHN